VLANDGSITEIHPTASRIARKMLGDDIELSPGGMIVLSTDVNATAGAGWVSVAKRLLQTWWNRTWRNKIVDEELSQEMKEKGVESGWSIGNLFRGRYFSPKTNQTYNEKSFNDHGIMMRFVQDNHSYSTQKGVLRGLHFQNQPYPQTKLVRCVKGKIWDVAVDLRRSSSTYLKWIGIELSEDNHKMFFIPHGFAHGFITLEENTEVQYKVDNFYNKSLDRSIYYADSKLNINWKLTNVILSDKDKNAPLLKDSDINFK
jgi:dTDP-4-dehydrorhamnose 3,5-epimerase